MLPLHLKPTVLVVCAHWEVRQQGGSVGPALPTASSQGPESEYIQCGDVTVVPQEGGEDPRSLEVGLMEPTSITVTMGGHSRQRRQCAHDQRGLRSSYAGEGIREERECLWPEVGTLGGCRETRRACAGSTLLAGSLQMLSHCTASLAPWLSLLTGPACIIEATPLVTFLAYVEILFDFSLSCFLETGLSLILSCPSLTEIIGFY